MANFTNIKNNQFYYLIEISDNFYDLRDSVELAVNNIEYPRKPTEPRLPSTNPTDVQLKTYLEAKTLYPAELDGYLVAKKIYDENEAARNEILTYACYYFSGLLEIRNTKAQDRAWSMAWDSRHSAGYSEVYNYLIELVELLEILQESFPGPAGYEGE